MNIVNIDKAIAVMKRAKNLNMMNWQTAKIKRVTSIEDLHACGNSACFAGYIAISPEFKADGGTAEYCGSPYMDGAKEDYSGYQAIAIWLEIPELIARLFVFGAAVKYLSISAFSEFYNEKWNAITPEMVIERLECLKEIGPDKFLEKYASVNLHVTTEKVL